MINMMHALTGGAPKAPLYDGIISYEFIDYDKVKYVYIINGKKITKILSTSAEKSRQTFNMSNHPPESINEGTGTVSYNNLWGNE